MERLNCLLIFIIFFLLCLFKIILCKILLPNDRVHAILADIGKTIKPIPVIDRVSEIDVAPILTISSTVSNIVVIVLCFLNF